MCSRCAKRTVRGKRVFANATFTWERATVVAREPESGGRALLPCPMAHATRHARAVSRARATAARTQKPFRALPVARLAQIWPKTFDINETIAILMFWLHVKKRTKGIFFRYSATPPHPTAKQSRGWLRVGVRKPRFVLAESMATWSRVTATPRSYCRGCASAETET